MPCGSKPRTPHLKLKLRKGGYMANGTKYMSNRTRKTKIGGYDMPELHQNDTMIRIKRIEATLRRIAKADFANSDRLLIER
jgi:hypothetical protein